MSQWEFVANANCGTGAGGFKKGNTCARGKSGGGKSKLPGLKEDELALKRAINANPVDEANWQILADIKEDQGDEVEAARLRAVGKLVKSIGPDMEAYISSSIRHHTSNRDEYATWKEYDDSLAKLTNSLASASSKGLSEHEEQALRNYLDDEYHFRTGKDLASPISTKIPNVRRLKRENRGGA